MRKHLKRILIFIMVLAMVVPAVTAITNRAQASQQGSTKVANEDVVISSLSTKAPKYIFLFIGDGMSYPQIQAASYYLGTMKSNGGVETQDLEFMNFPVAGTAKTFDSTSFCPDSASTATSIATGYKTYSGTINMDTTLTIPYETISEKLKQQKGYKIGVISSVNLNHATPAAFYAHQASRNNYYEIGIEMVESGFDYFAGGALLKPTGNSGNEKDLYKVAEASGYKVIKTQEEAEKLTAKDGKAIVIAETLADSSAMSYDLDAAEGEWRLADYVEKGIEVLDNNTGFFMMVESGKIDWACHANDAAATIQDTIAFGKAVDTAIDFYKKHPNDTLILVTGDHETGGLTIGFAGTKYDTFMTNLANQKISYAKFDSDYITRYKKYDTKFETVLSDIKANFGLMPSYDKDASKNPTLVLTDYEYHKLLDAYNMTMNGIKQLTQEEKLLYGSYEPLTVTITHILNNKSGIDFTSYSHTGVPVPVFAIGNGQDMFEGYYDNTDIFKRLAQLTAVK
ncbi:alkaline phosphatase [Mobilitalea sibirica]|uniref:Alkaline phosphatase n=1 Tax=Mobilitalea sibirica TaxID=1462919 RepID=A0A8J7HE48_9FIRM|nr:alkaline phosphatase [Mobilitalea sibirica]MBH1941599.1 alkaline phosphatase [Mobilitalea sibirica]